MSKQMGRYFLCTVINKKLKSTEKLEPHIMLNLFKFLGNEFGNDYEGVQDFFNMFPVTFTEKYTKSVQMIYLLRNKEVGSIICGYAVYAYNKTKAERTMQEYLASGK